MSLQARQQLMHLSQISTLLARFESVDRTVPTILSLMSRTLRVRGATLISNRSGRTLTSGWKTENTSRARSQRDEVHARTAYGYLTGVRAPGEPPENGGGITSGSALSSKDLRTGMAVDERSNFVVLPLVVQGGRVFGALQVEGDVRLDESDLQFVNAVVGLLALALDRQELIESKDAIVRASREHAAQRFTELQQTERAQRFLADVGSLLSESIDYRRTVASVLRAAVPFLADVCFVDDAGEKGNIVRIAATGADAPLELTVSAEQRLPSGERRRVSADPLLGWRQPQDEVLATRRPIVLPDPSGASTSDEEEQARTMNAAGFGSMMVVPLIAQGEALGAVTFALRGQKRRYGLIDLALAQEVARRIAIAVDHARLHRQAQRAVAARENILNVVSHDLRNPLSALSLSAALLSEDLLASGGTSMRTKPLEIIQRAIKRMDRMIGDLLDSASIDSGRLAINKDNHVFQALVEETIEGYKSAALERSQQLDVRLPQQEILVACDRGRITQVLGNLIGNAIKFTPEGGSIMVSTERHESEIRVTVSDTGAGIAPTHLARVFDRLFQGDGAASIGTGLGLYISKGIIQSHGGALWVESELGKGSTFFFTLPLT